MDGIRATKGETSNICRQHLLELEDKPQNIHTTKLEKINTHHYDIAKMIFQKPYT